MPDEKVPGSPTDDVAAKMAELEALRASVEADRKALASQRAETNELNQTMSALAQAIASQNRPQPEPEEELPEEYDEQTVRASAALTKRALTAYHNEIAPELESLRAGQFESEWERVRMQDPKNFDRMKQQMRGYFDGNPNRKRPGAVQELFVQMRGTHFEKLQQMDAAERTAADPIPEVNPLTMAKVKSTNVTTFNEDELRIMRGMRGDIAPEDYYFARHGEQPNFPKGYLEGLGFQPKEQ